MQSLNIGAIDNISHIIPSINDGYIVDNDIEMTNKIIDEFRQQFIKLENVGFNLIDYHKGINKKILLEIFAEMIEVVSDKYLNIPDYDFCRTSPQKLFSVGKRIYEFLFVDLFNTILPNFCKKFNLANTNDIDKLFSYKFNNDYTTAKIALIDTIKDITELLSSLLKLDSTIRNNPMYKEFMTKYAYYIELIELSDERFWFNIVRPLFIKYSDEIIEKVIGA